MYATIDIGTNSVLLLIGEPDTDGKVRVVEDIAKVTKLGEGVADSGIIDDGAAERTLDALGRYWKTCVDHKVERIKVVGTEALRRAKNAEDFLLVVKRALNLDVEIISSEREAMLTFKASSHDFGNDIIVVDIGGGSTEFVTKDELKSAPIGCLNLTERFLKSDPITEKEVNSLRYHIRIKLERCAFGFDARHTTQDARRVVATAGTATTLMAIRLALEPYVAERVHGQRLQIRELNAIIDDLRSKALDERKKVPGLIPERADVILAGAIILDEAMKHLGCDEAIISDRGVKWGLFYEEFCS